jgi:hypothetical protein
MNDAIQDLLEQLRETCDATAFTLVDANPLPPLEGARLLVTLARLREQLDRAGRQLSRLVEKAGTSRFDDRKAAGAGKNGKKAAAGKEE